MEETTNITSTPEVVNTEVSNETTSTSTEESTPELNKESQVENNKTVALQQEREKRKEAETELNRYRDEEAKRVEKDKLKKGKYEEVLTEKNARLAEVEAKLEAAQGAQEKYNTFLDTQVNDLLGKIPEGKKEFVSEVIEGKTHDSKIRILNGFADEFKSYDPSPTGSTVKTNSATAYEQAKAAGDVAGMIAAGQPNI